MKSIWSIVTGDKICRVITSQVFRVIGTTNTHVVVKDSQGVGRKLTWLEVSNNFIVER